MQTMWLRHHNNAVRKLQIVNRNWPRERLFQEARKIVGAVLQHITYNEWLPLVLGEDLMKKFGLTSGLPWAYDSTVDAGIM